MISDFSRLAYRGYLYLMALFQKPEEPVVATSELEDVISKLTEAQRAHTDRINKVAEEAADLLKTLTTKETQRIEQWKGDIKTFLMQEGIDEICIDEFVKNPSLEKLEELRSKYPKAI